ncbi:unnamed protein product, partial [Prorocentrum cordatum]
KNGWHLKWTSGSAQSLARQYRTGRVSPPVGAAGWPRRSASQMSPSTTRASPRRRRPGTTSGAKEAHPWRNASGASPSLGRRRRRRSKTRQSACRSSWSGWRCTRSDSTCRGSRSRSPRRRPGSRSLRRSSRRSSPSTTRRWRCSRCRGRQSRSTPPQSPWSCRRRAPRAHWHRRRQARSWCRRCWTSSRAGWASRALASPSRS